MLDFEIRKCIISGQAADVYRTPQAMKSESAKLRLILNYNHEGLPGQYKVDLYLTLVNANRHIYLSCKPVILFCARTN